jgi:hypothetical protein
MERTDPEVIAKKTKTSGRSRRLTPFLTVLIAISLMGCAGLLDRGPDSSPPPAWIENPPDCDGFLCGFGRCGKTYLTGGARKIAIARAAKEIFWQARGMTSYEFSFEKEAEDGTFSVQVSEGGEKIRLIESLELVEEYLFTGSDGIFPDGTHCVLLKHPASLLRR